MKKKETLPFYLFLYILIVFYITLFSRAPSLMSVVHLDALWSYRRWIIHGVYYARQVLLNVGLFIPIGWLVSEILCSISIKKKFCRIVYTLLLCVLFSVVIEIIQLLSGRGSCDVDDVINNSIGALIGTLGQAVLGDRLPGIQIHVLLILAGLAGCFMIQPSDRDYNAQFFFDIENVEVGDTLTFSGRCHSNGARTPRYTLLLKDESGAEYKTDLIVEGEHYTAKADVEQSKYEVLVHFYRFPLISTDTYINGEKVDFVPGDYTEPVGINGILKAYSPEFDTYVYQDGNRIVWYIGYDIEPGTEIVYHIFTNKSELLPDSRLGSGFDNRGFRPGGSNELEPIDGYRVFEKEIPTEYPVTSVTVGFNPGNGVTWRKSFRLSS